MKYEIYSCIEISKSSYLVENDIIYDVLFTTKELTFHLKSKVKDV